jgi:molecular chaperone IbpA
MRTIDFTPLFRSTVGYDRMQRMLDSMAHLDEQTFSYPPYNIESYGEDAYRITMAVAGFGEEDLDLTVRENRLLVSGKARVEVEGGAVLQPNPGSIPLLATRGACRIASTPQIISVLLTI